MRIAAGLAALLFLPVAACTSEVTCGDGTHRAGGMCVADAPGMGGAPTGDGGSGTTARDAGGGGGGDHDAGPSGGGTDAGPGFSTEPPVDGAVSGAPPGCDEASGACAMWAADIAAAVSAAQGMAGCGHPPTVDARLAAIAQSQADAMATADRLDAPDPAGDLFTQMDRAGVAYRDAGALFSTTRRGPDDVMTRWQSRMDTAAILRRCDSIVGAGVATSATGASYVTVVLALL